MSTKIYHGARFPLRLLPEFITHTRVKGLALVEKRAFELLSTVEVKKPPKLSQAEWTSYPRQTGGPNVTRREYAQAQALMKLVAEAAAKAERDPFDLSCGWNIWCPPLHRSAPRDPIALASPWGAFAEKAPRPRFAEDFGYWNNSDRPKSVTEAQWRQRRDLWEVACAPSYENHKVTINVFDGARYGLDASWLLLRLTGHTLTNGRPFGNPRAFKQPKERGR